MSDIVERLRFHPADEDEVYGLFNEAAEEIERLREQLELTRNYGLEEIERLRKDVQNLNRDCMMLAADRNIVWRHEWREGSDSTTPSRS